MKPTRAPRQPKGPPKAPPRKIAPDHRTRKHFAEPDAYAEHAQTAALMLKVRVALGMNQVAFAKAIDMSQPLVSKMEFGDLPPSLKAFLNAYRLARGIDGGEALMIEFENFMVDGEV